MQKLAIIPLLVLAAAGLIVSKPKQIAPTLAIPVDGANRSVTEEAPQLVPKPFRPEWSATPLGEGLLGNPVGQVCAKPNCSGCDLDKDTVFRKKPGYPKYQP